MISIEQITQNNISGNTNFKNYKTNPITDISKSSLEKEKISKKSRKIKKRIFHYIKTEKELEIDIKKIEEQPLTEKSDKTKEITNHFFSLDKLKKIPKMKVKEISQFITTLENESEKFPSNQQLHVPVTKYNPQYHVLRPEELVREPRKNIFLTGICIDPKLHDQYITLWKKYLGPKSPTTKADANMNVQLQFELYKFATENGLEEGPWAHYLEIKSAGKMGWGVFAKEDLPADIFLFPYPSILEKAETIKDWSYCFELLESKQSPFAYNIKKDLGNHVAAYLNHADHGAPDCNVTYFYLPTQQGCIPCLRTIKPIPKGTQLCYDYGSNYVKTW